MDAEGAENDEMQPAMAVDGIENRSGLLSHGDVSPPVVTID